MQYPRPITCLRVGGGGVGGLGEGSIWGFICTGAQNWKHLFTWHCVWTCAKNGIWIAVYLRSLISLPECHINIQRVLVCVLDNTNHVAMYSQRRLHWVPRLNNGSLTEAGQSVHTQRTIRSTEWSHLWYSYSILNDMKSGSQPSSQPTNKN